MDEQLWNSKKSADRMSVEDFHSKKSSFKKYRGENGSLLNQSSRSGMSIQNYDGPEDLLKKLSGSDSAKIPSQKMSIKSSSMKNKSQMLGKSNQGVDKIKLGQISLKLQIKDQELFDIQQLNHECDCLKYKKTDYCPMYCSCYNAPQKCSQRKCCKGCFQSKETRLPEILQTINGQNDNLKNNRRTLGSNSKKTTDLDVGIYIDGGKKGPKKFRQQRCQCRNSKCENKYCVCFTAGNKCTIKCLCENCRNSDFIENSNSSSSSRMRSHQPYLESSGSNQSLSDRMEFQPPQF